MRNESAFCGYCGFHPGLFQDFQNGIVIVAIRIGEKIARPFGFSLYALLGDLNFIIDSFDAELI